MSVRAWLLRVPSDALLMPAVAAHCFTCGNSVASAAWIELR